MDIDTLSGKKFLLIGNESYDSSKECLKFLFSGVKENNYDIGEPEELKGFFKKRKKINLSGERGLYFTTYHLEDLVKKYENLSFFNHDFINNGYVNLINLKIVMEGLNIDKGNNLNFLKEEISLIENLVKQLEIERLVIDPLGSLFSNFKEIDEIRNGIDELSLMIDKIDCKILLSSISSSDLTISYKEFNDILREKINFDQVF